MSVQQKETRKKVDRIDRYRCGIRARHRLTSAVYFYSSEHLGSAVYLTKPLCHFV